ncbi:MAG: TetR/AcrR family transcriptional regulator [Candidatus Cyclobacteriaceae bacterium M2_1C_046]
MTHREEKSAKLKLLILQNTIMLSQNKTFKDIYVQEICEKCKVSKVTFFKYFPQKEDVLLFYFRIWSIRCALDLAKANKEGLDAIYFIFEQIGKEYDQHKNLILALVSYLSSMERPKSTFPVKAEERDLFFPDSRDVKLDITTLHQMLEKYLLEAIFKKQITKISDTTELTNLFVALFYGNILTAHLRQKPIKMVLHHSFNDILSGIR